MGNCCARKKSHDPNQPLPQPAHPPTGVGVIQSSCSNKIPTSSTQQQNSSSRSKSSRSSKAKPSRDEQGGASSLQERNKHVSSHSCKEKPRRNRRHGSSPTTPRDWSVTMAKRVGWVPAKNLNFFCYSVLRAATQKFSNKNLIGEGGFGRVHVGYIDPCTMKAAKPDTGKAVAIKMLRQRGPQGDEEWQNELRLLSKLNHPNVVNLMGYCYYRNHKILVYDYMCKGSLDKHLSCENNTELNWSTRIKIAVGVARAVNYLHTHPQPIIHRDLKASNVLLDVDFNPRLSDFGLARYGPLEDQSHISTRILGTRGYFAPEYFTTGHLTVKSDVYSFGVVLLEIFTGFIGVKKYTDGTTRDIPLWAKPYLSSQLELHNIIDKKIARNVEIEEAQKFASIIRQCLRSDPKDRSTMSEVLANLEQLQQDMLLSNLNSLGLSKYHRKAHIF